MPRAALSLIAALAVAVACLGAPAGAQDATEPTDPTPTTTTPPTTTAPAPPAEPSPPAEDEPEGEPEHDIVPPADVGPSSGPVAPLQPVDPIDPAVLAAVVDANTELQRLDGEVLRLQWEVVALDADLSDLRDEVEATRERIEDLERDQALTADHIDLVERLLRERAIHHYMVDGTDANWVDDYLEGRPNATATRRVLMELHDASDGELLDELDERTREQAERHDQLEGERADLDEQVEVLDHTRSERQGALDDLETVRADAADQAETARIALARALGVAAEQQADLDAALLAINSPLPDGYALDGYPLCNATGIVVACDVANRIAMLLAIAAQDGVALTGGGWRSTAVQIQLRIAHCDGDVFGRPASACSPPTARPGSSNHERGLAIDFERCSSHATPCWQWLNEHGAAFGLENLASEPWHWDIHRLEEPDDG